MDSSSAGGRREIRVFVSSTFQDMHAEREELIKRTFPELRRLCAQRGVTWGDVDLRWGVTDEQKAEGKVLPICLEEIDRCRPFFLGLLGERYGSIPLASSYTPGQRENLLTTFPWLRECLSTRSVTEIEMLHGVLNYPALARRSLFYFRDPKYIDRLPQDARPDHQSENQAAQENLELLKQRIRESRFP